MFKSCDQELKEGSIASNKLKFAEVSSTAAHSSSPTSVGTPGTAEVSSTAAHSSSPTTVGTPEEVRSTNDTFSLLSDRTLTGGGSTVYLTSDLSLSQSHIVNILTDPDTSRISTTPPVKPSAGDVYLIQSDNKDDWKCDQYQWIHYGSSSVSVDNRVLEKRFYKIKLPGMKTDTKEKKRPVGSLEFKRSSFNFKDNKQLVLVHYEGNEKIYVPSQHGNSKQQNGPEFIRTAPSVLQNIEEKIKSSDRNPMDVYRESVCDNTVSGNHQGVLNARNLKQIQNISRKVTTDKRLSKDDIYNLVLLAYHLDGFIHEVTVFPDLTSIVALPEMISTVNQLLDVNTDMDSPFVFYYDTTFKLGDFYVSPLVFRNIIFEQNPIMPVAFLIHARKKEKVHDKFFDFVSSTFPKISRKSVPFVTDREVGIVNAISSQFPNCDVLMCWNHLINDFKFNLQKSGADADNIAVYISNLRDLLRCSSEEEYTSKRNELVTKWTKCVYTYFLKIEKDILKHCGKWIIEKYCNLYDPFSGITNNPCESMNAVIKRFNNYRELPVDCFVLSMYYLQNFYIAELQRGLAGIGNFRLRNTFQHAKIPKDEIFVPKHLVRPDDIVKHVMDSINSVRDHSKNQSEATPSEPIMIAIDSDMSEAIPSEPNMKNTDLDVRPAEFTDPMDNNIDEIQESETIEENKKGSPLKEEMIDVKFQSNEIEKENISQKSLAKLTVENGKVTFVEQQKAFMVKGSQDKVYAVTLLPKETCQCPSTSTCYHILAAKLYIGDEIETKTKVVNLRMLSRRNLKRNDKKSGRKKPRPNDCDIDIVPAPDSEAAEEKYKLLSPDPCTPESDHVSIPTFDSCQKSVPKSKKKLAFSTSKSAKNTFKSTIGKKLKFSEDNVINDSSLPVKKRKISLDTLTGLDESNEKWVCGLTTKHLNQIKNKEWLCSDILNASMKIIAQQFSGISGFQPTTLAPSFNEHSQSWNENFGSFKTMNGPAVQIHHTGKSHWVTSLQNQNDNSVYVLDSLTTNFQLTASMQIQLAAIYKTTCKKSVLHIKLPEIQQQTNGHDCGLYALANLIQFCYNSGYDTTGKTNFIEHYMRDHLIDCLEKGHFTPFPQSPITSCSIKIHHSKIDCNCSCGKPDIFENMVGCEAKRGRVPCSKWVHEKCAGITPGAEWFCREHR